MVQIGEVELLTDQSPKVDNPPTFKIKLKLLGIIYFYVLEKHVLKHI